MLLLPSPTALLGIVSYAMQAKIANDQARKDKNHDLWVAETDKAANFAQVQLVRVRSQMFDALKPLLPVLSEVYVARVYLIAQDVVLVDFGKYFPMLMKMSYMVYSTEFLAIL